MGCASSTPEADKEVAQKYVAPPEPPLKETPVVKPVAISNAPSHEAPKKEVAAPSPPPPAPVAAPAAQSQAEPMQAQDTLARIGILMQKFAEVRSERTTPVQVLRRVLDLVVADCKATFACVQTISDANDCALVVAMIGSPDNYLENNRLQRLGSGSYAAEAILRTSGANRLISWKKESGTPTSTDWQQLAANSNLLHLSAAPVTVADKTVGLFTLGLDSNSLSESQGPMWGSYMQLIASSLSGLMKDNSVPKYMPLVKDVHDTLDLDGLVHKLVGHFRLIMGHVNNTHIWYRMALTASSNASATIFDDLTQLPTPANQRSGSAKDALVKDVQAQGGVIRSVVNMKSTVMKISIHNRQQVMIPDVQKLINQSGNVSIDIFNTRLIKPPTSVLVFPLKVKQNIFGVVFCMSGVQSDFAEVSPRLRELCEVMSPHLLQALTNGKLINDYEVVQNAAPNPDGSHSGTAGIRLSSFSNAGEPGSNSTFNVGGSISSMSGEAAIAHSRSSTGALVTGLTEKLNQKRLKSAMDFSANQQLGDLQITNLLGEGGFAKVFRGLWRGLTVGIKIVVDDGKNEKMVMKNAHEIAILSTLSHPHVTQAYMCLTDVIVQELIDSCMRQAHQTVIISPALKYLQSMLDKVCHIEVIEYCDLGNLSTALKNQVFVCNPADNVLEKLAEAAAQGHSDVGSSSGIRPRAGQPGVKINVRGLLLTLIEIASAMSYLHSMGVVHCDMKPANVLLKSSNNDPRGFTVKVSDFGLSRVEDDDNSSSFPFNSCGTAAYVAPEALICNKKVNSSVDVYAFGILMWEMYTAQRPYGNMKQQQLVEEVVMRGLRPKFPSHAPPAYIQLAQSCWSGSPNLRPTFSESLVVLNGMLSAMDDHKMRSNASFDSANMGDGVEYMPGFSRDKSGGPGGGGKAPMRSQ